MTPLKINDKYKNLKNREKKQTNTLSIGNNNLDDC